MDYSKKKLYKVHVDVTLKVQMTCKTIPMSLSIFADNEQDAKVIARHLSISNVKVDKCKMEFDFSEYINKHNIIIENAEEI